MYQVWYTSPNGARTRVGACVFNAGCNQGYYETWGDADRDGKDDCIVATRWINMDGGFNDGWKDGATTDEEPYLDLLQWDFDPTTDKLSWRNEKYNYTGLVNYVWCSDPLSMKGGLEPGLGLIIDPLVGPDTEALFSRLLEQVATEQPYEPVSKHLACDANRDGRCNTIDELVVNASVGLCKGNPGYSAALATLDFDDDGCLTSTDAIQWRELAFTKSIGLSVTTNLASYSAADVLVLTAGLTKLVPQQSVDAYIVLQLPSGQLLSLQIGGQLVPGLVPIGTQFATLDFDGVLVQYRFNGTEPKGSYTWYAALTQHGTLNVIGPLRQVSFTVN